MRAPSSRTLLDATAIPKDRGGVGRYVDGLAGVSGGSLIIVCQERDAEVFHRLSPNSVVHAVRPALSSTIRRLVWEQMSLPRLARRLGASAIFSPHYTLPLFTRLPRIVTFHDATFFSDPDVHTPIKRLFFRFWTRLARRLARVTVVPSRATADELDRYLGRSRRPVVVALHGVDHDVFHRPTADDIHSFARAHQLPAQWIAFLGTLEPRKNLPALVRGYRRFCRDRDAVPALVIAGAAGWDTQLAGEVERGGGDVRTVGYLDVAELPAFLGGAMMTAYPSLGEGFGLPVLEAMATGAAVVTTRRLALPEVGGEAVAYTEPDADSIAATLTSLADDAGRRAELSGLALARASLFTWQASFDAHLRAFEIARRPASLSA